MLNVILSEKMGNYNVYALGSRPRSDKGLSECGQSIHVIEAVIVSNPSRCEEAEPGRGVDLIQDIFLNGYGIY